MTDETTNTEQSRVGHALGEAVAAIYFDDNSDYKTALWQIIRDLGGEEAVELLSESPQTACHVYAADRDCT